MTMHSDDDRYGLGGGFRYPGCSSAVPSFHAYPETDPLHRDSVTLLEAGRDDSNAWAKKFTELNRVGVELGFLSALPCSSNAATSSLPN